MRSVTAVAALFLLAASAHAGGKAYGKPLKGLEPTKVSSVLEKPEAGKAVALKGSIKAVCQEQGCWVTLEQDGKNVHVAFENHSFFVPKDSFGRKATIEGRVIVKERPKTEVEHLEGEGAKEAGAKVSIEATGIVIEEPAG